MRVLLDTNIVLDVLLKREPHYTKSLEVWQAADAGKFEPFIAAFSLPTIHYICERQAGFDEANAAIDLCMEAFHVCPLYRECIMAARKMSGTDFEDNLQVACAVTDFLEAIVTRNVADFTFSPILVYPPQELLDAIGL